MVQEPVVVRQEYLRNVEPFCRALREALRQAGLGPEDQLAAVRSSLSAECVQCGIHVSGEELLALLEPPTDSEANPKVERMRLGDCARKGCDTYYYRLRLQDHPQLHWPTILAQFDTIQSSQAGRAQGSDGSPSGQIPVSQRLARALSIRPYLGSSTARRAFIAIIIVGVFLTFRQLYLGGRIPLIREPEHFRVAPASTEEAGE